MPCATLTEWFSGEELPSVQPFPFRDSWLLSVGRCGEMGKRSTAPGVYPPPSTPQGQKIYTSLVCSLPLIQAARTLCKCLYWLLSSNMTEQAKATITTHEEHASSNAIQRVLEPDRGYEAVFLDISAGHIEKNVVGGLKLAKDGHVSPFRVGKLAC
jgi:hypothetical protein